jgi:hypothetical protein
MKKLLLILSVIGILTAGNVDASYITGARITAQATFSDGYVHFQIENPPLGIICNHWGYSFRFDARGEGGKNMYKAITLAVTLGKTIEILFDDSTLPGTDHTNGCDSSKMAVATAIVYLTQ